MVIANKLGKVVAEQQGLPINENIKDQLTTLANSDTLFNAFVDLMMTQYEVELELAQGAKISSKVMDNILNSENALQDIQAYKATMTVAAPQMPIEEPDGKSTINHLAKSFGSSW